MQAETNFWAALDELGSRADIGAHVVTGAIELLAKIDAEQDRSANVSRIEVMYVVLERVVSELKKAGSELADLSCKVRDAEQEAA